MRARKMRMVLAVVLAVLMGCQAIAQEITFSAETTVGVESVVPMLSWDTRPLADDCEAFGDWSGPKGGAGNETLTVITSGATYNLVCRWTGDTVTMSWVPPTENTDGTAYTDPGGYKLYFGRNAGGPYPKQADIDDHRITEYLVKGLRPGNWYFVITAYNQRGTESERSGEVRRRLGTKSAEASVGISVNPRPKPPTLQSIAN